MPVRVGKRVERRVRRRVGVRVGKRVGKGDRMDGIRMDRLMKERDKNMTLDKSVFTNHSTIKL